MFKLLRLLDINYPLIQAPMAGVTTPALAAAVSNAGALGSLGVGAMSAQSAYDQIQQVQALTEASFNVNVFCHQAETLDPEQETFWLQRLSPHFQQFNALAPASLSEVYKSFINSPEMLEVFLETRPKMVSFHFGIPSIEVVAKLKSLGIVLAATATQLSEALLIERAGLDLIIAQGVEAGGHRGIFNPSGEDSLLSTGDLVALLKSKVHLPVIAAGGIMSGCDMAMLMSQGADAVQMGTAFLLTAEAGTSMAYRHQLRTQQHRGTRLTRAFSGRYARAINMPWLEGISLVDEQTIPAYPYAYDANKRLNEVALTHGNEQYGAYWAGTGVARIQEQPVTDLIAELIQQWKATDFL